MFIQQYLGIIKLADVVFRNILLLISVNNNNKMIRKVGTEEVYSDAMDVLDFEYEETDIDTQTTELTEDAKMT